MKAAILILAGLLLMLLPTGAAGQNLEREQPAYLQDRGTGVPTSLFGTYIKRGEVMVYPFYEYYYNPDEEYDPSELDYGPEADYQSEYRANEWLIFLGYGITDRLAIELEAATISAELNRAENDRSGTPPEIEESGLGDVQTLLSYYWRSENARRPGIFSYFETVFPFNKDKRLTGTSDFEFKLGSGLLRGFRWGTVSVRAAVEYNKAENKAEMGEAALEYLKRLNRQWRAYLAVEGVQDEIEFITEAQFHLVMDRVFLKLNNAFGLTPKAPNWAPEYGILIVF